VDRVEVDNRSLFLGCGKTVDGIVLTNNVAEFMSLINGLIMALQRGIRAGLNINMDSMVVTKLAVRSWAAHDHTLCKLRNCAVNLLKQFSSFTIRQLPRRHNGDADRLANEAQNRKQNDASLTSQTLFTYTQARDYVQPRPPARFNTQLTPHAFTSKRPQTNVSAFERGVKCAQQAAKLLPRTATSAVGDSSCSNRVSSSLDSGVSSSSVAHSSVLAAVMPSTVAENAVAVVSADTVTAFTNGLAE